MTEIDPVVEVMEELPPPAEHPQTTFWRKVMEQVEDNRGIWCKVPGVFDPSTATHLRQDRNTQVDASKVEVQTRTEPPTAEGRKRVSIFLRVR